MPEKTGDALRQSWLIELSDGRSFTSNDLLAIGVIVRHALERGTELTIKKHSWEED